MEKKYTFDELMGIVETLRGKEGCPWDREQTHESLRPCMMEEAAELLGAVRVYQKTGSAENLQEELGDILLQVALHSQIAKEEGLFTVEDVVTGICEKMIRRHPHVFGSTEADDTEQVLLNWEEIKKKEKEGKSWIESPLREIPAELPALTRALKVQKKIDKLYEAGETPEQTAAAMRETAEELERAMRETEGQDRLESLIGNLLLQISSVAGQLRLLPEQILTDRTEDLIDRYEPARE